MPTAKQTKIAKSDPVPPIQSAPVPIQFECSLQHSLSISLIALSCYLLVVFVNERLTKHIRQEKEIECLASVCVERTRLLSVRVCDCCRCCRRLVQLSPVLITRILNGLLAMGPTGNRHDIYSLTEKLSRC